MPFDPTKPTKFTNLTVNGTTVVKASPGFLVGVMLNTLGATANTLTLYDNTAGSGTKLATIDTTAGLGGRAATGDYFTGLTAVLATGTAADVTIGWQ